MVNALNSSLKKKILEPLEKDTNLAMRNGLKKLPIAKQFQTTLNPLHATLLFQPEKPMNFKRLNI